MSEFLQQYIPFAYELQLNTIDETVLDEVTKHRGLGYFYAKTEKTKNSKSQKFGERYNFQSSMQLLLNSKLWRRMLVENYAVITEVEEEFDNSHFFYDENTPAYVKITNWMELEDDEFKEFWSETFQMLEAHEITNCKSIVNVYQRVLEIKYFLEVKPNLLGFRMPVTEYFLKYFRSLHNKCVLSGISDGLKEFRHILHLRNGHEMLKELSQVDRLLKELLKDEKKKKFCNGQSVLSLLENKPGQLNLWLTDQGQLGEIEADAILQDVDPSRFFMSYMKLSNKEKGELNSALSKRYDILLGKRLQNQVLIDELTFLQELKKQVEVKLANYDGMPPSKRLLSDLSENVLADAINSVLSVKEKIKKTEKPVDDTFIAID